MSTSFFDDDDDDDEEEEEDDETQQSRVSHTTAVTAGSSSRAATTKKSHPLHRRPLVQQRSENNTSSSNNDTSREMRESSAPVERGMTTSARQREKSRSLEIINGEMDLDEILLDGDDDGDATKRKKRQRSDGGGGKGETDIERLMRCWMDERNCPELLHHREELVNALMERLEAQTEAANLLADSAASRPEEHERILLVQMEIERVRYLLRSYIRVRTYKIETFAQYLLRTPAAKNKLTDVEFGYAKRFQALLERHYTTSVVQNLPERLGRLDEEEMVFKPDLEQPVFACARRDCPPIRLPDGQQLEMKEGEIHMLRYRSVRRLLKDGDVRLV